MWYCVPEFLHRVEVSFGQIFFGSDEKKNYCLGFTQRRSGAQRRGGVLQESGRLINQNP
jgi:hypothetical protein